MRGERGFKDALGGLTGVSNCGGEDGAFAEIGN